MGWLLPIIVAVIFPTVTWRRTFVAECTVRVVSEDGRPTRGIRVSESWNAFSYGLSGGEDLTTDSEGAVRFNAQIEEHSLLFWVFMPVVNLVNLGVHASSGTNAGVTITEPGVRASKGFFCSEKECNSHPLYIELQTSD